LKLELVFRRVVLKLSVLSTFDYGEPRDAALSLAGVTSRKRGTEVRP